MHVFPLRSASGDTEVGISHRVLDADRLHPLLGLVPFSEAGAAPGDRDMLSPPFEVGARDDVRSAAGRGERRWLWAAGGNATLGGCLRLGRVSASRCIGVGVG